MNTHKDTLQDLYLSALCNQHLDVNIFLVNGIKLQGRVIAFDGEGILLKNIITQMIMKHAVSTIVPVRNVDLVAAGIEATAAE